MNDEQLMNRKEAARYLGVSPGTLANWKSNGRVKIPCFFVGRSIRYRKSDLDAYLDAHKIRLVLEG